MSKEKQRQNNSDQTKITKKAKSLRVDGGTVRLRTPLGDKSEWKNYQAVKIHERVGTAFFQNKEGLLDWVNQQPLSRNVTCLGDGHDGVKLAKILLAKVIRKNSSVILR